MFSLIVATDIKNGIGKMGKIPWTNSVDMLNFKRLTTPHVVVMGRHTWESLPCRPLPHRINVVISSTMPTTQYAWVFPSIQQMIDYRRQHRDKTWFIIGGSTVYDYFIEHRATLLSDVYWTMMKHDYECDTRLVHGLTTLQTDDAWETQCVSQSDDADYYEIKKIN